MTEIQKTLTFVVVALVLAGGAAWSSFSGGSKAAADFSDQGEKFFPDFTDPLASTALEVIGFDPSTASALPFKVEKKDGKWVIPSHHSYPADGKDRLAKTASGVIDLRKDTIRSNRADDHKEMGVVDPLDAKSTSLEGRGQRVTLKDDHDAVLADFIIGKPVAGREGQRYVRIPGNNRTYGVNVNVDLSTKFADWIETNLLKLDATRIRRVVFDGTTVDPDKGEILRGDLLSIKKADAAAPWSTEGLTADEELDPDKLAALTRELGDLKIVGVRPKPAGLTRELKASATKGISLSAALIRSLASRGFYLTRQGELLSNKGDVRVATDEGVVYTLRFGEVTFATGEALAAGADEEGKPEAGKKAGTPDSSGESRFLFVTAQFDPSLIPEPKPEKPEGPPSIPDSPFAREPDDPKLLVELKAEQAKAERDKAARDRQIQDGQKRVQELTDRFADWYYVVPGDAFRSVSLNRATLVRKKSAQPATPATTPPPSFPGFPEMPRL